MNYFQHSGFPWSVKNQGKTKIRFFKGRKKSGNSLKNQKRLKTKIVALVVYKKSKQMLACITGIIFWHFQASKVKVRSERGAPDTHDGERRGVCACHSIYACLRTPSHAIEKITPVIEASKCKLGLNFYILFAT